MGREEKCHWLSDMYFYSTGITRMYDFSHLGQSFQIHIYDAIANGLVAAIELVVFTAVIS